MSDAISNCSLKPKKFQRTDSKTTVKMQRTAEHRPPGNDHGSSADTVALMTRKPADQEGCHA